MFGGPKGDWMAGGGWGVGPVVGQGHRGGRGRSVSARRCEGSPWGRDGVHWLLGKEWTAMGG